MSWMAGLSWKLFPLAGEQGWLKLLLIKIKIIILLAGELGWLLPLYSISNTQSYVIIFNLVSWRSRLVHHIMRARLILAIIFNILSRGPNTQETDQNHQHTFDQNKYKFFHRKGAFLSPLMEELKSLSTLKVTKCLKFYW